MGGWEGRFGGDGGGGHVWRRLRGLGELAGFERVLVVEGVYCGVGVCGVRGVEFV